MTEVISHLIKRESSSPIVCANCKEKIPTGTTFHLEEGVNEHIHSLIARRFCSECYAKYGEQKLLSVKK